MHVQLLLQLRILRLQVAYEVMRLLQLGQQFAVLFDQRLAFGRAFGQLLTQLRLLASGFGGGGLRRSGWRGRRQQLGTGAGCTLGWSKRRLQRRRLLAADSGLLMSDADFHAFAGDGTGRTHGAHFGQVL